MNSQEISPPSPSSVLNNQEIITDGALPSSAQHHNLNVIKVFSRFPEYDWAANELIADGKQYLDEKLSGVAISSVRTFKVYYLSNVYSENTYHAFAKELLVDPVLDGYLLNGFSLPTNTDGNDTSGEQIQINDFQYLVETGYHPGVVDNEARTLLSAIKDYTSSNSAIGYHPDTLAASGLVYMLSFTKQVSPEVVESLFKELRINPLIERMRVLLLGNNKGNNLNQENLANAKSLFSDFFREFSQAKTTVSDRYYDIIDILTLKNNPAALKKLSEERLLYLSNEELAAVISYYEQPKVMAHRKAQGLPVEPTDVELEVIAQTWSEHCKHKIFAAEISYYENGEFKEKINSLYRTYIKEVTHTLKKTNPNLLSVFSDNAGVFRFDEDTAICMKVETHNSPSSLDPFGGAITGIVGVNRDIIGTGIGAKPLFNTDVFCFGYPNYSGKVPAKLFHPKRIMKGVHKGVEQGGNHSGIPTVNGAMVFDDRFMGKPLVFCGTGGGIPIKIKHRDRTVDSVDKKILVGDLIVMVGGRIGKDGIHGATFSSVAMDSTLPSSVVQIGDPIIQKKLLDFLMVARDELLYRTLTDNGAGGLSSSVGEMATLSGGCDIRLDKALLKYPQLAPWEILVSESQERMSLAVPPEHAVRLSELADLYDVEICFIGTFNDSGYFSARYKEQVVAELSLDFLHDGVPQLKLMADWVKPKHKTPTKNELENIDCAQMLRRLLARPNIASKEKWVRQYDHEVKALTILKPFDGFHRDAPMDAAVLKPFHHSEKGLVVSSGLCPRMSDIDSGVMALLSVDEALRNAVAVGGDPDTIYALDNFCWPDPIASAKNLDGHYKLAQLVRANQALHKICHDYQLPLISGKDSMKNDYGQGRDKISVPPTLLVTLLSVIPDYEKICSATFKEVGDKIYLLGNICGSLGASEFMAEIGYVGDTAPVVNPKANLELYRGIYKAIQAGLLSSCHDISDGGLGVAVVESALGIKSKNNVSVSVDIDLSNFVKTTGEVNELSTVEKLFSESAGCFVVSVNPNKEIDFLRQIKAHTEHCVFIGEIVESSKDDRLVVRDSCLNASTASVVIDEKIEVLRSIWKAPLNFD